MTEVADVGKPTLLQLSYARIVLLAGMVQVACF